MKFEWERWINAARGMLEAIRGTYKPTTERSNLSTPLKKHRQINVWMGLPALNCSICQFELDHWMGTCGPLTENKEYSNRLYEATKELREASETKAVTLK